MSPTTGVPLHFTIEALGLGVAGVILAWAAIQRRFIAAAGALLLATAQVLYAGQFFTPDSAGALTAGVLRLAGAAAVVAGAWAESDLPALVSGTAAVAAATIWRIATTAGPVTLGGGPRAIEAAGFVVLAVWAWRRASGSLRARIVAAFIGVLGAAVIVMGDAAARVSTTNALNDTQRRLNDGARAEQRLVTQRLTDLQSRTALGSAVLTQLGPSQRTLDELKRQAFPDADLVWFVDRARIVTGSPTPFPKMFAPTSALGAVIRSAAVDAALGGAAGTAAVDVRQGADFVAAVPVFRAGAHTVANALGAFVVAVNVTRSDLANDARSAGNHVAASLVSPNATIIGTDQLSVPYSILGNQSVAEGETKLGRTTYLVSMVRLSFSEPPSVALALSLPVSAAVDISTAFPRALVGGVLVAALLAVVIALWLASRITRPILSLADEAERVKSDFLATVSHELRTPLTPIRGYADLLRRGRVPRGRAEVYLDEIDEAARRLERIVSLLVEVAAMEAGRFSPNTQAVVPAELLAQAADRWRGRSRLHKLVVQVPKSLPRVAADPVSIPRVLDELIDNAFKFSPEGGTVELRARRAGDAVEFAVTDEGIGIDSEALDRLSEAFVQADRGETRRFGGLGLGLTFANGVLAAHDGRVSVRATKDGGATFTFELPTVGMVSRMPDHAETST